MDRASIFKNILGSTLMQEIVAIRLDTMWRMLSLAMDGFLPDENEEGATGKLDNKGAIFVPGGLILCDVDELPIEYKSHRNWDEAKFREGVRAAMRHDNATLLFPDGIAPGINLDSGFFSRTARTINIYKKAAFRRKRKIGRNISIQITTHDIVRSHTPSYMPIPFGSRTRISTCIAMALVDPVLYYTHLKTEFNLNQRQAQKFQKSVNMSLEMGLQKNDRALYPPCVIVCHDTRYKKSALTGLTRILGIGKFGEFVTFSLEKLNRQTYNELKRKGFDPDRIEVIAEYGDIRVLGMLRVYAMTNPGRRSSKYDLYVLSPQKDLNLDMAAIEASARERYRIKR